MSDSRTRPASLEEMRCSISESVRSQFDALERVLSTPASDSSVRVLTATEVSMGIFSPYGYEGVPDG